MPTTITIKPHESVTDPLFEKQIPRAVNGWYGFRGYLRFRFDKGRQSYWLRDVFNFDAVKGNLEQAGIKIVEETIEAAGYNQYATLEVAPE